MKFETETQAMYYRSCKMGNHQKGTQVHLQEGTRFLKFNYCPWCGVSLENPLTNNPDRPDREYDKNCSLEDHLIFEHDLKHGRSS